jgi:ribosome-associated protein
MVEMSVPVEDRALELARVIVDVLDEHKGEDILLLDLYGICSFADYFVLCTGASERTLGALAEEVARRIKQGRQVVARGKEGEAESGWILLDFGDVILHLFSRDLRDYYRLEDVWRTGRVVLRVQ